MLWDTLPRCPSPPSSLRSSGTTLRDGGPRTILRWRVPVSPGSPRLLALRGELVHPSSAAAKHPSGRSSSDLRPPHQDCRMFPEVRAAWPNQLEERSVCGVHTPLQSLVYLYLVSNVLSHLTVKLELTWLETLLLGLAGPINNQRAQGLCPPALYPVTVPGLVRLRAAPC